jgi:teichuronic acid biosynthesis glycosyltransferase TuaH
VSPVLVLGTADWNQAIATNQHYIVRELAHHRSIIFTESIGLRTPELSTRDLKRIAARLKGNRRSSPSHLSRAIPQGVDVRSPRIIPRHTGAVTRVNQAMLRKLVRDWTQSPSPRILWTYSPVTYGLERIADQVIYHCVDLLGEIEGISTSLIETAERSLSHATSVAIGSSEVVTQHLKDMGFENVVHWPNVADTEVISSAKPQVLDRVANRAVFAGNLSANKLDFDLLVDVVRSGVELHLAGPISEGGGDARSRVAELVSQGAVYHGLLRPLELASLYWTAQVGLIPYAINSYTRGVSPLKTYEYLAAGLAVVSTPVPSVTARPPHVSVHSEPSAFIHAVATAGADSQEVLEIRARLAEANSWTSRGAEARTLIRTLASGQSR